LSEETKIDVVPAQKDTFCVWLGGEEYWIDRVFAFRIETRHSHIKGEFYSYAHPLSGDLGGGCFIESSDQIVFCGSREECVEYIKDQKEAKP